MVLQYLGTKVLKYLKEVNYVYYNKTLSQWKTLMHFGPEVNLTQCQFETFHNYRIEHWDIMSKSYKSERSGGVNKCFWGTVKSLIYDAPNPNT